MGSNDAWADAPYGLISAVGNGAKVGEAPPKTGIQPLVDEMIFIHNVFLRAMNAIYLQCLSVESSPQDIADFVEYSLVWCELLHEHHTNEEADIFPGIEKLAGEPGLMAHNVEQHHSFEPGFLKFQTYLQEVKDKKAKYEGAKLRSLIEAFMPTLHQHLQDEIPTLIGLAKYNDKVNWATYWEKKAEEILDKTKNDPHVKHVLLPFVITAHDATFEGGFFAAWPPVPWFIRLLMRWVFVPTHKTWWRFAPCDGKSQPQKLPLA